MNESAWDQRTIEAVEAYRSGRDDLSDPIFDGLGSRLAASPDLAEAHRRIERLDAVLAFVIRDVPTPDGLRQRLLDQFALSAAPARRSRRRWLAASIVSTAAVLAMVAVLGYWYLPGGHTADEALDLAVAWFKDSAAQPGEPLPAELSALLKEHPPSVDVIFPAGSRWRAVDDFWGRQGVAYTLTGWDGARATLLVVRCERPIPGLGPTAPTRPDRTTGGISASAWQSDGLLYVLVVGGTSHAYRTFLVPNGPMA